MTWPELAGLAGSGITRVKSHASGYSMTGLYFKCTIYGKVPNALCIIVCMYVCVCMYDVGSYTCIEGFRLDHDLLNLSLWGTHSCMCVCLCVCLCVYLHTCMYMCAVGAACIEGFRFIMLFSIFICVFLSRVSVCVYLCLCTCTRVNVHCNMCAVGAPSVVPC